MADADATDPFVLDPRFRLWLAVRPSVRSGRPPSPRTLDKYTQRIALYLHWVRANIATHPDALRTGGGRDGAVAAYRDHLLVSLRPTTFNVTLSALNAFYVWLELGPVQVPAERFDRVIGRPLTGAEQSRLIAAAQARAAHTPLMRARRARNLALVMVLIYGGLRESEAADLDCDDLVLTGARSIVWAPVPGGELCQVAVPARAHTALAEWNLERAAMVGDLNIRAFFLAWGRKGGVRRLSVSQIEAIVRDLGRAAGLGDGIAPGMLRSTYAQQVIAAETDVARVPRKLRQVKADMPQILTLRACAPAPHPGRAHSREDSNDQLALDF
ncbi:tyrosine-type recombinase/integrase [Nocardia jejuensis]|uniref:tyrosine-type recombinase/integrase n=1 Tax=Nocardia jejuensis TaxID=328049 RepID=UPI000833771C|nr:tyrosine-type recombinase/integrase [Nocardia jejuensis]